MKKQIERKITIEMIEMLLSGKILRFIEGETEIKLHPPTKYLTLSYEKYKILLNTLDYDQIQLVKEAFGANFDVDNINLPN